MIVENAWLAHPEVALGAGPVPDMVSNVEITHGDKQVPPMLSVVSDWKVKFPAPEYSYDKVTADALVGTKALVVNTTVAQKNTRTNAHIVRSALTVRFNRMKAVKTDGQMF